MPGRGCVSVETDGGRRLASPLAVSRHGQSSAACPCVAGSPQTATGYSAKSLWRLSNARGASLARNIVSIGRSCRCSGQFFIHLLFIILAGVRSGRCRSEPAGAYARSFCPFPCGCNCHVRLGACGVGRRAAGGTRPRRAEPRCRLRRARARHGGAREPCHTSPRSRHDRACRAYQADCGAGRAERRWRNEERVGAADRPTGAQGSAARDICRGTGRCGNRAGQAAEGPRPSSAARPRQPDAVGARRPSLRLICDRAGKAATFAAAGKAWR